MPEIHLTHWGSTGPRILMIHGSAQGSSAGGDRHFSRQRALADRGFQIIVPDRPGHGQSPSPGRPDDAEADGEWIADLLGNGAHLVGHSFGGACALNAASRRPEAVQSLTLIEPAMFALAIGDARVRHFLFRLRLKQLFSFNDATRVKAASESLGIPPEISAARTPEEIHRMAQGLATLRPPKRASLTRELAIIEQHRIPLMLVTGGWNPAFTAVGDIVARQGHGEHLILPSRHHSPHLASDAFNDWIESMIRP